MPTSESSVSFPALGSIAVLFVSEPSRLERAREAVEHTVTEFDLACSRFREDSELSAVNAGAGEAVAVGPVLRDAVLEALRAARLTDGDVDPTVGRSLVALGYDRDFDQLATPEARAREITIVPVPGWRTVQVDTRASTVRVPSGVMLDLGATAKALAADRAAAAAHELAGCGVLVSLGGDIAIAGPAPGDGWRVRVTDDHRSRRRGPGAVDHASAPGGLATSSTPARRWHTWRARPSHHLVNPANGRPVATALAHGQRVRRQLPRRQHRHARRRSSAASARWPGSTSLGLPRPGWSGSTPASATRRLAVRRRRPRSCRSRRPCSREDLPGDQRDRSRRAQRLLVPGPRDRRGVAAAADDRASCSGSSARCATPRRRAGRDSRSTRCTAMCR